MKKKLIKISFSENEDKVESQNGLKFERLDRSKIVRLGQNIEIE